MCAAYRVELCELFYKDTDEVLAMIQNSIDTAELAEDYTKYTGVKPQKQPKPQTEEDINIWDFI